MLNFLFWNLQKKNRDEQVAILARECAADIICLAEGDGVTDRLNSLLCFERDVPFLENIPFETAKIRIFSRFDARAFYPTERAFARMTIWRLVLSKSDLLLATIHLQSKASWSSESQTEEIRTLSQRIRETENKYGHTRTIALGDFNMNPFEIGMVAAQGMHGVMTRSIAQLGARKIADVEHPFFYNPMWGFFGDRSQGPAGTHFSWRSEPICHFWNIFDQVLVRPSLLSSFSNNVRIVDSIGGRSLLRNNGRPDKSIGSDHLPITFSLDLEP